MPYAATLISSDLDYGKRVTEHLEASDFPFKGVFWLYDEGADNWQLIVVTDLLDEIGRGETYRRLDPIIDSVPGSDLHLFKITVMSPQTPLYKALATTYGNKTNVEGIRLPRTVVSGFRVPDAYLYEIHK